MWISRRNQFVSRFALLALVLSVPVVGSAQEKGSVQGGGASVIYVNGKPRNADPFHKPDGVSMNMSQDLRQALREIQALLERYGVQSALYWENLVFGRAAEFRYAEPLPCHDPLPVRDPNAAVVNSACTVNGVTYLKESLFKGMNLRDQALTLLHDRIHAFVELNKTDRLVLKDHDVISDFVAIIGRIMDVRAMQLEGNRDPLSTQDRDAIERLFKRAEQLGFELKFASGPSKLNVEIRPGGGLVRIAGEGWDKGPEVSADAFIGVGTLIGTFPTSEYQYLGIDQPRVNGGVVLDSKVDGGAELDHAHVIASALSYSRLSPGSAIIRSNLVSARVGRDAMVVDSRLVGDVRLGDGAEVSRCELSTGNALRVTGRTALRGLRVSVGMKDNPYSDFFAGLTFDAPGEILDFTYSRCPEKIRVGVRRKVRGYEDYRRYCPNL